MKRSISIILAAILAVSMLTACGQTPAATTAAAAQAAAETTKAPEKPAEVINMKLATVGNPGDGIMAGCEHFANNIGSETGGAVAVEVFPSSQLGGYTDYISGLQMGSLQIAEIDASVLSSVAPKFSIFGLPYISSNLDSLQGVLKGEAGEILNKDLKDNAGLMVIGWICRPARSVYSSKGPINSVEDFEGLKIRTMESAPMLRAMELLGAKATPIPTAERYLALQTKVVDAAENNLVEINNAKEYEVTKYLSLTEHIMQPTCICISAKYFDSLPADVQAKVLSVGEAAGDKGTETDWALVDVARGKLEEQGMIINEIHDKTPFKEKVAPLYEEYYSVVGEDLIKIFQGK